MAGLHLARLRGIYGDSVTALKDYLVTKWGNDPYTLGSWFLYDPDATPADYELLISGIGHLMFGGEHTCGRYYGFVQGAVLTGVRDGQMPS